MLEAYVRTNEVTSPTHVIIVPFFLNWFRDWFIKNRKCQSLSKLSKNRSQGPGKHWAERFYMKRNGDLPVVTDSDPGHSVRWRRQMTFTRGLLQSLVAKRLLAELAPHSLRLLLIKVTLVEIWLVRVNLLYEADKPYDFLSFQLPVPTWISSYL